ncbi:two-component system response regulator ResD [Solirubrobacter pauli]|uniref:Two-component system response regulator ResD n=1 Tax=Solirubrobacter pauli TaxID=166793 RepID=A0A660LEG9_9ACTN|nr:two-component system response regulator ResD [Solirubrobacter pauli]
MRGRTILLVEDEHGIASAVEAYLERAGFGVVWVRSGEEALAERHRHPIALVVLDLGLAGSLDGLDVLRELGGRTPVIVISARDDEADRVAGLELGADDYVGKPFSPRELVARVSAVLRRADRSDASALTLGPIEIDEAAREVRLDGHEVELTRREFDLLTCLVRERGRVVERATLLESVWPEEFHTPTRTVEVHVAQLRRKLGRPDLIRTVRGVGYKAVA